MFFCSVVPIHVYYILDGESKCDHHGKNELKILKPQMAIVWRERERERSRVLDYLPFGTFVWIMNTTKITTTMHDPCHQFCNVLTPDKQGLEDKRANKRRGIM